MGGNLILIILIATNFTPTLQGFYYTFTSLLVLQFFAELGLGSAVIQSIGHSKKQAKKESLIKFFLKWYIVACSLLSIILLPAIFIYSTEYKKIEGYELSILLPWFILCLTTSINLLLNGILAIIEGLGQIKKVSTIRLKQTSLSFVIASATIILGGGLYSIALGSLAFSIIGIMKLKGDIKSFRKLFNNNKINESVDWKKEILPFQWRVAISWISGFFIFYFFTPLVMKTHGPIAAGQLGMSLQIMQAINSLSSIWISTNFQVYGQLISKRKIKEMNTIFLSGFKMATLTLFLILLILYFGIHVIEGSLYQEKILPAHLLAILLITLISNHIFFALNYYVRSFKKDSFWLISAINAIVTIVLCLWFIPKYGNTGAVAIYAFTSFFFSFLISMIYFLKLQRKLHNQLL